MAEAAQTRARKQRERTAKWRAAREARRVPEARQIDRAVLVAFAHYMQKGPMTIDHQVIGELTDLAVNLLARRHDRKESRKALLVRMRKLATSREIPNMLTRAENGQAVTP